VPSPLRAHYGHLLDFVLDFTGKVLIIPSSIKQLSARFFMPVYEFECECGHVTEGLVKLGTKEIPCPECNHKAKKIMSLCTFELKGSGWYADGYSSTKK